MVEAQHSAEPLDALDNTESRFVTTSRLDQPIIDPLVIPLPVIMSGVLASRFPKRPFSEEDHPVEALVLDRSDETLRVGVQVGRPVRQAYGLDIGALQKISESGRVLRVPIEDDGRLTGR